ncbi:endomucin isoform X4 [Numida meleagris]|uniref:endomucin isoform X4 n=1 Tax=Numida meleagris TaxID=8996 RepID=UPI000B3E3DF2|nr:endomucin isoform X4 [Numida meleagris]
MELLGTACLLLAALCTCALGQGEISNVTVNAYVSTSMPKTEEKAVNMITSRAMTLQTTELTTTTASTMTVSVTTSLGNTTIPANATEGTTQHTIVQQPAQVTPTARSESDNTTSASQVNGTQSTQNESSSATTAKTRTLSPTASLQENTTAPGTSNFGSPGNSSENTKALEDTIHYSSVILPIVIALIVITLSAFSLVALYRVCHKKTPDRQENGTEQAQSDKEGVKLLSVKTTSAETGENQGKNKTRQCDDSSSNFSSKYM